MKLRADQLRAHLGGELLPVYLVSGEEPLQRESCVDAIRSAARDHHFDEREVLHVDRRFDWSELAAFSDSLSLFASRRLLELRLEAKLDDTGRKALQRWCERPPEDVR